ncbi:MAG: hypothetical protein BWX70_02536 [Verrucomicrobia bacterium ADurb.Bin070]|nr:MAG: hypothetical protein BWX70_02536 [Verrucomicrobia bacterium ADurb.Bin070]
MVVVARVQFGLRLSREAAFGQQDRAGRVGQQQRAFRADDHRRFGRIRFEPCLFRHGLHVGGRIDQAVEPLHGERLAARVAVAGEGPGDVVALRPDIPAARGIVLPAFLHLGGHGQRRGRAQFQPFPDRVEDMAADVAGPAGAEILPGAPLDGMIDVRRVFARRCGAQPEIPRQMRRRRLALGRPRADEPIIVDRARAVGAEDDVLDRADHAFTQPLHGHTVAHAGGKLGAELGHDSGLTGGLCQQAALGHIVAERLLAVDVLAGAHGRERDRQVHVIRHRGVDRINLIALLGQHLAPVCVAAGFRHKFRRFLEMVRVHVTDRRDARTRMREEIFQVIGSHHAADTDAGVVDGCGLNRFARCARRAAGQGGRCRSA